MTYHETRRHELRKRRIVMVDGNLTANTESVDTGACARVYAGGYWGFASSSATDASAQARVLDQARRNASAMQGFGVRDAHNLPAGSYRGEHPIAGKPALSQAEAVERLRAINAWAQKRYTGLQSLRLVMHDEHHGKWVTNSVGANVHSAIDRAAFYVMMTAQGDDGAPVELFEPLSCKGSLADLDLSEAALEPFFDTLHGHLQAKRHAVPARGGDHCVVLAPQLAGMLAHEAMGHPCEADLVLGGSITGRLHGQRVASDLVTMIDVAHHFRGEETMVPVYADDEGTPAEDAVLIDRGILKTFMNSRDTAARLGHAPTGSARAYAPNDEPLVRMRNTVILPGERKLSDMIAEVDEGYYLVATGNGQADSTTEFMFGVTLAYEIRKGKLGPAIRDTTLSGSAIKVLQSVDAVSDDMYWTASGYCGKKQPMVVSMGGPALRARAQIGGE
ncbi:MAG: hypothetical protein RL014_274 [Pseudomonadota bacterium]|jgi:TldD protein